MRSELETTLGIYELPAQSLWRALELRLLRELSRRGAWPGPVLEIGCGDGAFASAIFSRIDLAIDINPRAVSRAKAHSTFYGDVRVMDARKMNLASSSFGTVFANCVIEHISDIETMLSESYRVLRPGGILIATVPLLEMNQHLFLRGAWYTRLRRRKLAHVNLLSLEEWQSLFRSVGFDRVETYPYLFAEVCHLWDVLDLPANVGWGRYTLSNVVRLAIRATPLQRRVRIYGTLAQWLAQKVESAPMDTPCAIACVSYKDETRKS